MRFTPLRTAGRIATRSMTRRPRWRRPGKKRCRNWPCASTREQEAPFRRRSASNRLRHPAEEAVDQAGAPRMRSRCRLVLGDAAVVKIIQELDVVRLGDGEVLLADEYRVVVEERPD